MERPENISEAVWQKHLDWFNVTGETSRRHLRELREGSLGRRYQGERDSGRKDGNEAGVRPAPNKQPVEADD